jgi:hypothetical protein
MSKSESGWGRYGFQKVCMSGTRLDRLPGPVRSPYPAKNVSGVVFWHAFVRVSTPNGARPPLPINIKGHGRLKGYHNRIYQTYLLSYLHFRSSLPYFSNPTMMFFLHLHDVWRCPSWPAEPRTTLRAPPRRDPARATSVGLLPDLPGDTGLTGDPYRSDRYSVEALQGAPLRACGPRKGANISHLKNLCLMMS